MARLCNDYGAEMARDHPGRFGLFASMPMPDVDGTLKEIEYALDQLKADGIGLMTSYRRQMAGRPGLRAGVRGAQPPQGHRLFPPAGAGLLRQSHARRARIASIEYPHDTTRAVVEPDVQRGVCARFKDIRFIFSHAGGFSPGRSPAA